MKLSELTALYSPLDIEYNQTMSGPYSNLSVRDEDCEVIAGLKDDRISGFWRPMVACGNDKALQVQIEKLWLISQDIYYMDFLISGELSVISKFLLKQGYQATPYYTQIINLTKSKEELHADVRKSYTSLINKYSANVCSSFCIQPMKEMHIEQRGWQTRSDKTWEIQRKMILADEAYITATIPRSAACLIYHNRCTAYYAVGCSDEGKPSHAALWEGILEAQRLGCKTFELGEQVFSGDPKLVNISHFKAGFGGRTVMRLILEKP